MCRRIKAITSDSFKPNWASIASNAVRSSHAISTMRDRLASQCNSFDELIRDPIFLQPEPIRALVKSRRFQWLAGTSSRHPIGVHTSKDRVHQ